MKQPNVHYEFCRSCKVAVALGKYLEVELKDDETEVHEIPVGVAMMLDKAKEHYGEQVEIDDGDSEDEEEEEEEEIEVKLYSASYLVQAKISELRTIGKLYDVTDNKKDELAEKILVLQPYTKDYLATLDKEDQGAILIAMKLESQGDAIATILAAQENA